MILILIVTKPNVGWVCGWGGGGGGYGVGRARVCVRVYVGDL